MQSGAIGQSTRGELNPRAAVVVSAERSALPCGTTDRGHGKKPSHNWFMQIMMQASVTKAVKATGVRSQQTATRR